MRASFADHKLPRNWLSQISRPAKSRNEPRAKSLSRQSHCCGDRRPAMAKTKTLDDLFHDTLRDIYYAEKQILKALPKMAKGAQSSDLAAAFEKHRVETEGQIDRLEQVFEIIGKASRGKKC